MKKSFILLAVFFNTYAQQSINVAPENRVEIRDQLKAKMAFLIDTTKEKIESFKEFQNPTIFQDAIKNTRYNKSKIKILSSKKDGIIFDFGYPSSGDPNTPFKGVRAKLELVTPDEYKSALSEWSDSIVEGSKSLEVGKLLALSPSQEGLLKMTLLIKDRKNNLINKVPFIAEFAFLVDRLNRTPGTGSMSNVILNSFAGVRSFLDSIRVGRVSARSFLEGRYETFKELMGRDFHKKLSGNKLVKNESYEPDGSLISRAEARGITLALMLQTYMFSEQVKDQESVKKFFVKELAYILQRLEDSSYKLALAAIFNPFLEALKYTNAFAEASKKSKNIDPEPKKAGKKKEPKLKEKSLDELVG